MKRFTFAVVVALLVFVPWRQAARADATRYTIENLGNASGLTPTVTGVNAAGHLSGYVNAATGARAVRYVDGIGWQVIPGLETADFSQAFGINDAGEVVGVYFRFSPVFKVRAFRYSDAEGLTDIDPIAGGTMSLGFGINANGDVVGASDSPTGAQVGFVAVRGGASVALPLPGSNTTACGINAAGVIVGSYTTSTGATRVFRYRVGDPAATDVPPLVANGSSAGCAIDAAGRVGGQTTVGPQTHAFRNANGVTIDVDTFGSSTSNLEAIAEGTSVGWYTVLGNAQAFVHTDADGSVDLTSLVDATGWGLRFARAINSAGMIAGEGTFNGQSVVFRLTPIKPVDTTPPVIELVTATPATIWPPKGQTVTVTTAAVATDDSGDAPVCSLTSVSGSGSSVTGAHTGTVLAIGGSTYTFTETCADAAGNAASKSVDVVVLRDTTAPTIHGISATPSTIWPPNNKFVPVSVSVSASDDVDEAPSCSLTNVSGGTSNDYWITGNFSAVVRATKNDDGSTRVYSLTVTCGDLAGNHSAAAAKVSVTKDGPDEFPYKSAAKPKR